MSKPTLPWPLPALASWALAWAVLWLAAKEWGLAPSGAVLLAVGVALGASLWGTTRWRRVFIAVGFPLSLAASGWVADVPTWVWLLPLVFLVAVYPLRTWRDAPLFPTPFEALSGLATLAPLPDGAKILDAGCGLGHGLAELHREYPGAELTGFEWSWPLRIACARRAPYARVRRANIWRADWSRFQMVYLFQRPDTMARAADKASRELRPGAWMVSLDFEAAGLVPTHTLEGAGAHRVWLYQAPFTRR